MTNKEKQALVDRVRTIDPNIKDDEIFVKDTKYGEVLTIRARNILSAIKLTITQPRQSS